MFLIITTIFYPIIQYLNLIVLFTSLCTYGFYMFIILTVMYQIGWIHRIGWYIIELECCKLLNGTPVTIGSYRVDIFRGKVWISNLIIHSPTNPINSVYSSQLKHKLNNNTNNTGSDDNTTSNNNKFNSNNSNMNRTRTQQQQQPPPPMEWKWEAPILARIGKIYVECNLLYCIFSLWFLWEEAPLELYTVHVSDIQAFVERRNNIYNFYLCDPHVIIPDVLPTNNQSTTTTNTKSNISTTNTTNGITTINHNDHSFIVEETGATETVYNAAAAASSLSTLSSSNVPKQALTTTSSVTSSLTDFTNGTQQNRHDFIKNRTRTSSLSPPSSPDRTTLFPPKSSSNNIVRPSSTDPSDLAGGLVSATSSPQREKAQKVVDDMVSAVRRAATNGDWQSFLLQQRDVLTQQLRAWKDASSYQERGEFVSEGVKIIQQVSKSVVETTQQVSQVVIPARRDKLPSEKTVYARIGRVLIENVRVFLHKQQQQVETTSTTNDEYYHNTPTVTNRVDDCGAGELSSHDENDLMTTTTNNPPTTMLSQHWNKSIYVHRVAIRASEFCPPLSAIDQNYRLDEISNDNNKPTNTTTAANVDIEVDSSNNKKSSTSSSGNKMPCLYQPIEKSLDVVLKRMFAEMAKSNTDLFFKAAMEEMADVFATSTTNTTTTTSTTATTTTTTTANPPNTTTNTNTTTNAPTSSSSVFFGTTTMSHNNLSALNE